MQFYLIPSGNGFPQELTGTQADARLALRERQLRGKPEEFSHDVPTSKAELMTYVNGLLARQLGRPGGIDTRTLSISSADAPMVPVPDVPSYAAPRSFSENWSENRRGELAKVAGVQMSTLDILDAIPELEGSDLGRVALAAAERLKELAT